MKKVTSKSIRTGQTIYLAMIDFSTGWDAKAEVWHYVIGSNKVKLPCEGCVPVNPVNLNHIKKWLAHSEKRPEARVKVFYSRRRALREVKRLNKEW